MIWVGVLVGFTVGFSYAWLRPGGVLDLHVRLELAVREIRRLSGHPAGRALPENVVALRGRLRSVGE